MERELEVKGIAFTGALRAFERQRPDAAHALERAVTGPLADALREGFLASRWYPVRLYSQLLQAMLDASGQGVDALRVISRQAVADDFRTLFRLARVLFAPQTVATYAMRFNQRYYTGGEIAALATDDTSVRFRFAGYRGFDRRTWTDLVGGCEGVLVGVGCADVTSRVHTGGGDADFLEATFSFGRSGARLSSRPPDA